MYALYDVNKIRFQKYLGYFNVVDRCDHYDQYNHGFYCTAYFVCICVA